MSAEALYLLAPQAQVSGSGSYPGLPQVIPGKSTHPLRDSLEELPSWPMAEARTCLRNKDRREARLCAQQLCASLTLECLKVSVRAASVLSMGLLSNAPELVKVLRKGVLILKLSESEGILSLLNSQSSL